MHSTDIPYQILPGPVSCESYRLLHGANYFSGGPIMLFTINLNEYHEVYSNQIPGFYERLTAALPSLIEHHCSEGVRGGFFMRVKDGTLLGHVMEHVAIELQDLAGMHVSYGKTRSTLRDGVYNVIFRFRDEVAGAVAGMAALNLINAILDNKPFDLHQVVSLLISIREERLLGPTTQAIADCAANLEIPWLRLDEYNLIQLGTGRYQQRIRSSLTGRTPALALDIIADRKLTLTMLRDAGIAVPPVAYPETILDVPAEKGILFPRFRSNDQQGWALFCNSGMNTSVLDHDNEALIFVKTPMLGVYRFLVTGDELTAVASVEPPRIIGNGLNDISDLISKRNVEDGRQQGDKGKLSFIQMCPEAEMQLKMQGLNTTSVPVDGQQVLLGATANPSNGSYTISYTKAVHHSVRHAVIRAVKLTGCDVAGVDVLMQDPSQPFAEGDGILQLVAAPNFRMHLNPAEGEPSDVALPFVKHLFPDGTPNHAPLLTITGSHGKTTFLTLLQKAMKPDFPQLAVLSSVQLSLGATLLSQNGEVSSASARLLMRDPSTEMILCEVSTEMISRSGLPYESADMAVVLNIDPNETEAMGYHLPEDLAYAKSVVAEQVYPEGLVFLNAADPLVAEMAERVENPIVWFSDCRPDFATLPNMKCCVFGDEGHIMLLRDGREHTLAYSENIASVWKNKEGRLADAVLATIAVCLHLPEHNESCLKRLFAGIV